MDYLAKTSADATAARAGNGTRRNEVHQGELFEGEARSASQWLAYLSEFGSPENPFGGSAGHLDGHLGLLSARDGNPKRVLIHSADRNDFLKKPRLH